MADIFNEIDEELRQEKLRKLWDRYGVLVLAAAVAVVLAVAGWRAYDHWRSKQAEVQGDAFVAAARLAGSGDLAGAEAAFTALAGTSSGSYPSLAGLRAAALKAEAGDKAGAVAAYDALAARASTTPLLGEVARIRAAQLAVDLEDRAALEVRVGPLAAATRPFRSEAREILALVAWKAGDFDTARKWLEAIETDPETPRDLLDRTAMLTALISAHASTGKAK